MTDLSGLSPAQLQALINGQPSPDAISPAPAQQPVGVQALPPVEATNSFGQPTVSPNYDAGFDLSKLTPEQLMQIVSSQDPTMSTGEDMARSGGAGILRGVSAVPTMPRSLMDLGHAGVQAVADFGARHGFGDGKLPDTNSINIPGIGAVPGLSQDLQILAQAGGKMLHMDPHAAGFAASAMSPLAAFSGPTAEEGAVAANNGVPLHVPQTTPGRYVERVGEFAPFAAAPGGLLARAARAVVPGVASRAGEDVAPEGYKPVGALLGALLGGGVVGGGEAIANAPQKLMGRALSETHPDAISAATDLQRRAQALGVHLTPFEALDQVTNGAAKSGTSLQHFVENSPVGRRLTAPIFADRPNQLAQAVSGVADKIAPEDTAPSVTGLKAQEAAQGTLDGVRQKINEKAAPFYDAMGGKAGGARFIFNRKTGAERYIAGPGQAIPEEAFSPLVRNPAYAEALGAVRSDPLLNAGLEKLPDNNVAVVNEVVKQLDSRAIGQRQTAANPSGNNYKASLYQNAREMADQIAAEHSPQWRAARGIVRQGHEQILDPLEAGPLGGISKTEQLPTQVRALYPNAPPEGAAVEAGTAAQLLPKDIAAALARHNITDTWNAANTDLQSGQNQWAGSRFAKALAGHSEQQKALFAGVNAVDPEGALGQQIADLLETGRATGKRWAPGSLTQFNEETAKQFGTSPTPVRAVGALLDPLEIGRHLDRAVGGALYKRNVEAIAKVLSMAPDDAEAALQSAKATDGNIPLIAGLLAAPKTAKKP